MKPHVLYLSDRKDRILDDAIGCNGINAGIQVYRLGGGLRINVGYAGNLIEVQWRQRMAVLAFSYIQGQISTHLQWWGKD